MRRHGVKVDALRGHERKCHLDGLKRMAANAAQRELLADARVAREASNSGAFIRSDEQGAAFADELERTVHDVRCAARGNVDDEIGKCALRDAVHDLGKRGFIDLDRMIGPKSLGNRKSMLVACKSRDDHVRCTGGFRRDDAGETLLPRALHDHRLTWPGMTVEHRPLKAVADRQGHRSKPRFDTCRNAMQDRSRVQILELAVAPP